MPGLRTEQTTAPASFFERAKAWLLYSSNLQMRQIGAGALATVLVIGGGTFALRRLPAAGAFTADFGYGARFAVL